MHCGSRVPHVCGLQYTRYRTDQDWTEQNSADNSTTRKMRHRSSKCRLCYRRGKVIAWSWRGVGCYWVCLRGGRFGQVWLGRIEAAMKQMRPPQLRRQGKSLPDFVWHGGAELRLVRACGISSCSRSGRGHTAYSIQYSTVQKRTENREYSSTMRHCTRQHSTKHTVEHRCTVIQYSTVQ